jgi:hypothetical protein
MDDDEPITLAVLLNALREAEEDALNELARWLPIYMEHGGFDEVGKQANARLEDAAARLVNTRQWCDEHWAG